jgi:hypothetical protein
VLVREGVLACLAKVESFAEDALIADANDAIFVLAVRADHTVIDQLGFHHSLLLLTSRLEYLCLRWLELLDDLPILNDLFLLFLKGLLLLHPANHLLVDLFDLFLQDGLVDLNFGGVLRR